MLGHFWLFAILASLALGAPVSRESDTPSLTLVDLSNTKVSYGPKKMGLNKANEAVWDLKGKKGAGSKAVSDDLGTSSLSSYSASSSGVSSNSTSGGISSGPTKLGLNHANKASWNLKGGGGSKTILPGKGISYVSGSSAYSTGVSGAVGGF